MGRRGGCVGAGCLAVAVVAGVLLVLVVGAVVSLKLDDRKAERDARDQLASTVDGTRAGLSRAAADGVLVDTEIRRAVTTWLKSSGEIRRDGRRVTVTARFAVVVGGGFAVSGDADGCFRFEVVPAVGQPPVSVREMPYKACGYETWRLRRDPADVADDVVAELRAAVTTNGAEGARTADVWTTPGIEVEDTEWEGGRFTALVWLSGAGREGRAVEDCYEFRVRSDLDAVFAKKLEPDGCYRIERERDGS
ncbi:hypothetical protein [Streptomyces sp. NPDC046862]|uniref:hypothetical protein n=1 Tax=Streptomyces sp. NPDC046862 TaxID=3154603 RepID=UPI003456C740